MLLILHAGSPNLFFLLLTLLPMPGPTHVSHNDIHYLLPLADSSAIPSLPHQLFILLEFSMERHIVSRTE